MEPDWDKSMAGKGCGGPFWVLLTFDYSNLLPGIYLSSEDGDVKDVKTL